MSSRAQAVESHSGVWARFGEYVQLTKPRIALLVLVVVAVSGYVASWGNPDLAILGHTLLGTLAVAASATALNQYLERDRDARMERTAGRPLPAGRLAPQEVLLAGFLWLSLGLAYLSLTVGPPTMLVAAATWLLYVCAYTPLKGQTVWNTVIGAAPGAAPVFIGWTAMGGSILDPRAAALFLVVFLWQFPHFMAIAWLYRRQYDAAGIKLVTVSEPSGRLAGWVAVIGAAALLPVSLLPIEQFAAASPWPVAGILLLGLGQFAAACRFGLSRRAKPARTLLRASLIYLPLLLVFYTLAPVFA